MSADGSVTLVWGDGENKFRFAIGQFRELQEKINQRRILIGAPAVGPMSLLTALKAQDVWPDDVRDILRIGLVGGGMPIKDAHRKLVTYFDNSPPLEHALTAFAVLFAGLVGVPEELPEAVKKKKKSSVQTTPSTSDKSTETALQ